MFAMLLHPMVILGQPAPHVHADDMATALIIAACAIALVWGDWVLNGRKK
jgi:hypothetical protein